MSARTVSLAQRARVVEPTTLRGLALTVLRSTITDDESWSPSTQGELFAVPSDVELALELKDTDLDVVVQLTTRELYGQSITLADLTTLKTPAGSLAALTVAWGILGGTLGDLSDAFYASYDDASSSHEPALVTTRRLHVRDADFEHRAGVLHLDLANAEATMQDHALVAVSPTGPTGPTALTTLVIAALAEAGLRLAYTIETLPPEVAANDAVRMPGQSLFDYLMPIVRAAGFKLWADDHDDFYLFKERYSFPAYTMLPNPVGADLDTAETVTELREGRRRADQPTAVVVSYKWTDATGTARQAWDTYQADAGVAPRVHQVSYDTPFPGAGQAAQIYRALESRAARYELEARADWTLELLGDTFVTTPLDVIRGRVLSIARSYPENTMRVTLREDVPV
ncbi:MAG TPA: hypothetical protein VNS09_06320 [Solirubrobacter sp.]|nr:hypothetical protein [Solirubrobacter sp.]